MKKNLELIISEATWDGFTGGITKAVNFEITDQGWLKKRKGYSTFGEMVDVLWKINKQNKKMGFKAEYTVILPLKGTKPIYKKTLQKRIKGEIG